MRGISRRPGGTLPNMRKIGMLILFALLPLSLPAQAAPPAETIALGNSAATLPGPWKFSPGDSPWQNGSPVWAQPGFDDAHWATVDLAPKSGSVDPAYGTPGFVPGWTARGYPNLQGYAWYRMRVRVTGSGEQLWLKMPNDFDDGYQVYANGSYVGQFGDFFRTTSGCTPPGPSPFRCRALVRMARSSWRCAFT